MKIIIFSVFFVLNFTCNVAMSGVASQAADIAEDVLTSKPVRDGLDEVNKIIKSFSGITVRAKSGVFFFKNSQQLGTFGDMLTARRMAAMGYEKVISKYTTIHGVDGVYVRKWPNGEIKSVRIIENKINSSPYYAEQMSDQGIIDRVKKLASSNDTERSASGAALLEILEKKPQLVEKELWRHDISSGTTRVYSLTTDGAIEKAENVWKSGMIGEQLVDWCARGKITCEL